MKVALIGYGRMGRIIESILIEKGHEVSFVISGGNREDIHLINPENTDVCIEFTKPDVAPDNLNTLIGNGLNVVCGTTGWYDRFEQVRELVILHNTALVAASNFSIGVNLFFEVARQLSVLMKDQDYDVRITETHHTQKKDAPSGTAITLSEEVRAVYKNFTGYQLNNDEDPELLPVYAYRVEDVPGTHELIFSNDIDEITLRHVAFNRRGFALGAVIAAEFIHGKKGVFSIREILRQLASG